MHEVLGEGRKRISGEVSSREHGNGTRKQVASFVLGEARERTPASGGHEGTAERLYPCGRQEIGIRTTYTGRLE